MKKLFALLLTQACSAETFDNMMLGDMHPDAAPDTDPPQADASDPPDAGDASADPPDAADAGDPPDADPKDASACSLSPAAADASPILPCTSGELCTYHDAGTCAEVACLPGSTILECLGAFECQGTGTPNCCYGGPIDPTLTGTCPVALSKGTNGACEKDPCASAFPGGGVQLCRTNADCGDAGTCQPARLAGVDVVVGVCQ